jgi:hypothetical protein
MQIPIETMKRLPLRTHTAVLDGKSIADIHNGEVNGKEKKIIGKTGFGCG